MARALSKGLGEMLAQLKARGFGEEASTVARTAMDNIFEAATQRPERKHAIGRRAPVAVVDYVV